MQMQMQMQKQMQMKMHMQIVLTDREMWKKESWPTNTFSWFQTFLAENIKHLKPSPLSITVLAHLQAPPVEVSWRLRVEHFDLPPLRRPPPPPLPPCCYPPLLTLLGRLRGSWFCPCAHPGGGNMKRKKYRNWKYEKRKCLYCPSCYLCTVCTAFWNLVQIMIFGWNYQIWSKIIKVGQKFSNLVKNSQSW